MRTALRASISTAVLAGALLAPIAGTAHAATTTGPAAAAAGTAPDAEAGTPVLIGPGVVAVLRNGSEGPEARIHAVSDSWKPGDEYTSGALATLDAKHPKASVKGLELELVKSGKGHALTATKDGATKSYPLPQATAAPAECVSEAKHLNLGGGLLVELTMSPEGPKAFMHGDEPGDTWSQTLTRTSPQGSRDYFARIDNPSGAKPVFEWRTQGGHVPSHFVDFPALPKGCTPGYPLHDNESTTCVSQLKAIGLGAGLLVDLTMSTEGPVAFMYSTEPGSTWKQSLNRYAPQGSPDYFARINDPNGAKPVFEWKTQGGPNVPSHFADFPALPKGCTLAYKVTEETPAPKPEPSTAKPVTATTNVSAQTTGQTTVVPRGAVAAGAEIAAEDTDNSITVAAGSALLALGAVLGATFLRRRRSHS
ncbi:hypothetical protein ACXNSR_24110 [Streptomyces sp. NC-S4]